MNHQQVAHAWAHKTRASSNYNDNVYFDGPTIYSYGRHFDIASHVTSPRTGENLVIFTTRDYSVSTSKHKSIVRGAIPAGTAVLYSAAPSDYARTHIEYSRLTADVTAAAREIGEMLGKAARASKNRPYILAGASQTRENALALIHHFGKGHARRRLSALLPALPDGENIAGYLADLKAVQAKQAKQAAARSRKEHAQAIKYWRAGVRSHLGINTGTDLLRLSSCGLFVETSRSCHAPVSDCKAALLLAVRAIDKGETLHPESMKLGVYAVNEISPAGARVGCHYFNAEELRAMLAILTA